MFNIVVCVDISCKKDILDNIYLTLETFSNYLLFEEYRSIYLGHELLSIIKYYEKYFNSFDINSENYVLDTFQKTLVQESNLFTVMKNFYMSLKKTNSVRSLVINNWLEFKTSSNLNFNENINIDIKPYHSVVITKLSQLKKMLPLYDASPIVNNILKVLTPLKNLDEIATENGIHIDFVKKIAKQVIFWGFGKLIFKMTNYSIYSVNPQYTIDSSLIKAFEEEFALNLFETLNNFTLNIGLEKIYTDYYKHMIDNEKFIKAIVWLLTNEYLIQCSTIFISKLPFKLNYNYEKILINKADMMLLKSEMFDLLLEDVDVKNIIKDRQHNIFLNENKNNVFFENFLELLKNQNMEDFQLMNSLFYLISNLFYIEEISFYSGFRMSKLIEIFNKYEYIFDVLIEPIYSSVFI